MNKKSKDSFVPFTGLVERILLYKKYKELTDSGYRDERKQKLKQKVELMSYRDDFQEEIRYVRLPKEKQKKFYDTKTNK